MRFRGWSALFAIAARPAFYYLCIYTHHMKIALASPAFPASLEIALSQAATLIQEAAQQQATIICFPESYLPGYPNIAQPMGTYTQDDMEAALVAVCEMARTNHINVIMPMDGYMDGKVYNLAYVISAAGEVLGYQTKNQLDPSEDALWEPGTQRTLFEIDGLKFGITICHEGFRYPESVRWAATRGAHIVFHPHFTGSDISGNTISEWGHKDSPYYEKAMMMRAMENTIYFASVNYSMRFPESASSLIAPDGSCIAHQPYSKPGIVVADIDPEKATGLLAKRFKAIG